MKFSLRSLILLVALCGSAYGLWARWEPWVLDAKHVGGQNDQVNDRTRKNFLIPTNKAPNGDWMAWRGETGGSYDVGGFPGPSGRGDPFTEIYVVEKRTGNDRLKLHIAPPGAYCATFSPDGRRILTAGHNADAVIWDARTGDQLARLSDGVKPVEMVSFSDDGLQFVAWDEDHVARFYRRRRPEYWWGMAWLPEFWLTLVLGGGLVFSLWRDSRIMRA